MTLGTVLFAWALVAALFLLAARWLNGALIRGAVVVILAESLGVTLLAGLWFGSLGHGGWFTVFLLLGCLVAGAERGLRSALLRSPAGPEWKGFALGVARYLVAGALLAWRLG